MISLWPSFYFTNMKAVTERRELYAGRTFYLVLSLATHTSATMRRPKSAKQQVIDIAEALLVCERLPATESQSYHRYRTLARLLLGHDDRWTETGASIPSKSRGRMTVRHAVWQ